MVGIADANTHKDKRLPGNAATDQWDDLAQPSNPDASINVSALLLAKLDGTARGGVVLAIKEQLNIPVKFIGLGETPEDIETFDPNRFVDALFGVGEPAAA